ncbi:MAG: hypothetical protein AYK19_08650 [Theionarchaea archaeon DG-70-1]|nr:MAG: hypothetical protein AYK19_08650 [Theionarchaea archaeon DG-70-1]
MLGFTCKFSTFNGRIESYLKIFEDTKPSLPSGCRTGRLWDILVPEYILILQYHGCAFSLRVTSSRIRINYTFNL